MLVFFCRPQHPKPPHNNNRQDHAQIKIKSLEQQLESKDAVIARKEAVIAEVTEEYLGLKKTLGEEISKAVGHRRT